MKTQALIIIADNTIRYHGELRFNKLTPTWDYPFHLQTT